jgi:hypothetical protein
MITNHQIEPELLGPKPRLIVSYGRGCGCSALHLIPIAIIGLTIMLHAVHGTIRALFGPIVQGIVIERVEEGDEYGSGYRVKYHYKVAGKWLVGSNMDNTQQGIQPGAGVRVRVSPILPWWDAALTYPGDSVGWQLTRRWLLAFVWNMIVLPLCWLFVRFNNEARSIITDGEVAVGVITFKTGEEKTDSDGHKSSSWKLGYEFALEVGEPGKLWLVTGKGSVTKAQWDCVNVGESITILYKASDPTKNTMYRFGAYTVLRF